MRCPKCQSEMEYIPGEDEWPSRWVCVARVPYTFGTCGVEIVDAGCEGGAEIVRVDCSSGEVDGVSEKVRIVRVDSPGGEVEGVFETDGTLNGRR